MIGVICKTADEAIDERGLGDVRKLLAKMSSYTGYLCQDVVGGQWPCQFRRRPRFLAIRTRVRAVAHCLAPVSGNVRPSKEFCSSAEILRQCASRAAVSQADDATLKAHGGRNGR